jgi:digeranylgeranylglycerophospholipid reductase
LRLSGQEYDLAIVGAGFAGLTAAATAAARDLKVIVMEAKPRSGARVHTTGILVKEAAEALDFPSALLRKIHGVRLYAPNLNHVDLVTPGYYFAATDTDALLDWMTLRARTAGATILTDSHLLAGCTRDGWVELEPVGVRARFIIGADGPQSKTARIFGLGQNRKFLTGIEAEYCHHDPRDDHLHCFLDPVYAPGYLGWMVPGVGVRQIGIAAKAGHKLDLNGFISKIEKITGEMQEPPIHTRGGLIPCGGRVNPIAGRNVLLVGDAAGLVSPLTGGGIHRALTYGRRAALAVCDYLQDGGSHPGIEMARAYPTLGAKSFLRTVMNLALPNAVYNGVLGTRTFRAFANLIFFNRRNVAALREIERQREIYSRAA